MCSFNLNHRLVNNRLLELTYKQMSSKDLNHLKVSLVQLDL